ncbi:MAG: response regulator, partial [Oceanicaulis sp.]|nr:response regulator [Oceanicaulis sp.]
VGGAVTAGLRGARAGPGAGNAAGPRKDGAEPDDGAQINNPDFKAIIDLVTRTAPQNVSLYKSGTVERRIARRMAIAGFGPDDTGGYLARLNEDKAELTQLAADLLIHVTRFFRDPGVFEHLSESALPNLIASQPDDRPLRVWVAGCSTGEEAYSLAIVCLETLEAAGSPAGLQIFASDIDPDAIATAREGYYPRDIEDAVSPERLERFFTAEGDGWRVQSQLRDIIIFAVADLLSDPPFSRIDLVSCRNVLIYLEPKGQRQVIGLCSFALRPGGLLLLGAAETPGAADDRFEIVDKDSKLWRSAGKSRPGDLQFTAGARVLRPVEAPQRHHHQTQLADLCRRIILDNYAPAAVLLNRRLECLYLLGPTERYLTITQGYPHPGFLGMLPKALHARFREAAAACSHDNPLVVVPGAHSASESRFNIELRSVQAGGEQLLLACFVHLARAPAAPRPDESGADGHSDRIAELEADLEAARNDLRHAQRDLEQEVEVHAAYSAEALSVNEEFQSTNEELLASKEELQALNEELTALNGQLQETLERHRTTANDLQNVLFSTDVATLFLDTDLNIRFFTPAARAVFRVIATDIGRPLADLAALARDHNLAADARSVLKTSEPVEREIQGAKGVWFLRRVQPYRADGGRVEGVVITFADISERKRTHASLVAAKREADRATLAKSRFLAAASHDLRQPLQSLALLHGLMTRDRRTAEGLRLAALMDRTLHSMTEMLDSMLDVNRIESGIVRPNVRAIAIAPLLEHLGGEFAPQAELKGLRLRVVRSSAWVRSDPQLLEQILRNLLSNALKYTPKGGILLGCRIRGDHLTVQVCDTGIGVAEGDRMAIFDAYHRVEKANDPAGLGAGLGLGLSIVQRLADLLHHPVSLNSKPGKGSTFMVTLPLAEAQTGAPDDAAPARAGAPRQTGTVLLVENEEDLRQLMTELLEKEGHSVIAASNARDAKALLAGAPQPPDLLLTDLELPSGASGLALAKELPRMLGRTIPTIILTGDITTGTLREIAATPFDQIAKPVSPGILLDRISTLLEGARAVQAHGAAGTAPSDRPTLHVVDDDPMIRETTRRLFEAESWGVATYPSAEAFLDAPRPAPGDCLIADSRLPGMSGVELLKTLRAEQSAVPAIILTGHGDIAMAVNALKSGAADMIEKPASAADLLASVALAVERSTDARARTSAHSDAQKPFASLTPRERDVLARVLDGAPNKIIAADLGINQRTVENHRAAVMRKTGADSLPQLARLALAAGIPVA